MTVKFNVCEGLKLAADVKGAWTGHPVLLLHGGGQTRNAWKGTGRVLAYEGFFSVAVDLRGHGESDWSPEANYTLDACAADIAAIVRALGRKVAIVGASLGGLASLHTIGKSPDLECSALVLVDVAPKTRATGRHRIKEFMRANPGGFASVAEAADSVSQYLPHRPRPSDLSGLTKNLRLKKDGRYYWHWDPRLFDGGLTDSINEAREGLELSAATTSVPLLLVRGTNSEIVSEEDAAAFRSVAPQAEYVEVPSAHHMVAGDNNDIFSRIVVQFLNQHIDRI